MFGASALGERSKKNMFLFCFRVVADKDNIIMIGDTPRQFRMKMPEKEFYAFVAVGLR